MSRQSRVRGSLRSLFCAGPRCKPSTCCEPRRKRSARLDLEQLDRRESPTGLSVHAALGLSLLDAGWLHASPTDVTLVQRPTLPVHEPETLDSRAALAGSAGLPNAAGGGGSADGAASVSRENSTPTSAPEADSVFAPLVIDPFQGAFSGGGSSAGKGGGASAGEPGASATGGGGGSGGSGTGGPLGFDAGLGGSGSAHSGGSTSSSGNGLSLAAAAQMAGGGTSTPAATPSSKASSPTGILPPATPSSSPSDSSTGGSQPAGPQDNGKPLTVVGTTFEAQKGLQFTGPVASFRDRDGLKPFDQYSATIDWGDGQTSAGTIGGPNIIGKLDPKSTNVSGTHTYTSVGDFTITIKVKENQGPSDKTTSTAEVEVPYLPPVNGRPNCPENVCLPCNSPLRQADGVGGGDYDQDQTNPPTPPPPKWPSRNFPGVPASPPGFSGGPVRYADGQLQFSDTDLSSSFGDGWSWTRTYDNAATAAGGGDLSNFTQYTGFNWVLPQLPYFHNINQIVLGATSQLTFNSNGSGYDPDYLGDTLTSEDGGNTQVLTDTGGNQFRFDNNNGLLFSSYTDAAGNVTSVVGRNANSSPTEIQHSVTVGSTTTTESFVFTYDSTSGLMTNATLRRQVNGGSWSVVRQADYAYYTTGDNNGSVNDLKTVNIKDAAGNVLDTKYYRYYTTGSATGDLKFVFSPQSYARLASAISNPFTATDTQVAPYADLYLEYDDFLHVSEEVVQGAGCSSCSNGQGTYQFSYSLPSTFGGMNGWVTKTIETLPDGNTNTVYTNGFGEPMLEVYQDAASSNEWATFREYDSQGRVILTAYPSAVSGYDDSYADLLHNVNGNYEFLRDSDGLITTITRAATTTATDTTPGDAAGYVKEVDIQHGETGTAIPQASAQYIAHTDGNGTTIYAVASTTGYRNTDGTGAETTSNSYTWFTGTNKQQSVTVSKPVISSAQNGPGTADTNTTVFDTFGRPVWTKDGDGFINYTAYDQATGAVVKTITDVDTTQTSSFSGLPSGWSTPTGGGLQLVTQYTVDALGRTTAMTDPNGNVTYSVYNDPNHERRVYPGWNSTTHTPTGPTQVYREDRGHSPSYTETLTMSAAPAVDGSGLPTGTESVSGIQSLSRSYVSSAGQVTRQDAYFSLTGLTYSTSLYLGTSGTNYYETDYGYDDRGRRDRVALPTGTINRTVYDGLGRVVSSWVGTSDTPASGEWEPDNNTSPANMVETAGAVYDNGGVGDGNLTSLTLYPNGSTSPRKADTFYDWRDRPVAIKRGVKTTESTSTNRPITYTVYDNLSEATRQEQYDGDGVTITFTGGVPNAPSSSLLRAQIDTAYDDQGRIYQQKVCSVDPFSGSVSTSALTTNNYFDHRGNLIAMSPPGGLWTKNRFDGAGRLTVTYATDGGTGTTWANAGSVSGDTVLEQKEVQYDADTNRILTLDRHRFDNATATGALGSPSSGIGARGYYTAAYYDAANRLTGSVNLGTNGGSAYTRPSSLPSRSDTVLVTSYGYNDAGWQSTASDPTGLVTATSHDALGRVTQTIADYTDGTPTNSSNQTTQYTYDGDNHIRTVTAVLPSNAQQVTQYVYGVTTSSGSAIQSNDMLAAIKHPDPTTGAASSSQQDTCTVNALGQVATMADRNGSVHTYTYDVLGRQISDAVTTLGTGVDGSVRRIETAYDSSGNPYLFTSYDATSGGNIVNQVQRVYNGLGDLTAEYQSHSGAVNTSTAPKVQYGYTEMAGGANNSRLTTMTYPNGRVLHFGYASGVDSTISRLSFLADDDGSGGSGTHLEEYTYLGLETLVKRAHPQPGVDLTYIKQSGESNADAGDQYAGLDRFGRIVDQRWLQTSSGTATDRIQYGYDRDSNRLYAANLVDAAFSELYAYNGLKELTNFQRGTLNSTHDGLVGSATRSQSWSLDALGNWNSVTSDGTAQNRTNNLENEITAVGAAALTSDGNGNLTTDDNGHTLVYDAWNRLVQEKSGSTALQTYGYDALGRRVTENSGTTRDLYYSASWQVLEERVGGNAQAQYVWSLAGMDTLILRDRDTDGNGTLDERLYVEQSANGNVTSLVNASGSVVERYAYDSYGAVTVLTAGWGSRGSSAFAWQYLFQGKRRDGAIGLDDSRMRFYGAALGRFFQQDPIGFVGGANLYSFGKDSPINVVDPIGLAGIAVGGGNLDAWVNDTPGQTEGLSIVYTGPNADTFRVRQRMRFEVEGTYDCSEKDGKGGYCYKERRIPLPPNLSLDPKPGDPEHGHPHRTGGPATPNWVPDPPPNGDYPIKQGTNSASYFDNPDASQTLSNIAKRWLELKVPSGCTLAHYKVTQYFESVVYLNGRPVATYQWKSTSSDGGQPTVTQ